MTVNNGDSAKDTANVNQAMIQPWLEYWMKLFEQNSQHVQSLMAGTPPNLDFAQAREQWLGTMSKSLDAYLRSPSFLEAMRRNAETMTATKVTTDLAKLEMTRQAGIPHLEDIRGLYERLETAHEVVLERLQAIEARLQAIEKKLDAKS